MGTAFSGEGTEPLPYTNPLLVALFMRSARSNGCQTKLHSVLPYKIILLKFRCECHGKSVSYEVFHAMILSGGGRSGGDQHGKEKISLGGVNKFKFF